MQKAWNLLWCGFVLVLLGATKLAQAQILDVSTFNQISADQALYWCASDVQTTLEDVIAGHCKLQPVRPGDLQRGLDARAFWLKMTLTNSGSIPLERWVWVGHPRLEEIRLYSSTGSGWLASRTGISVPMDERDDPARLYGALSLRLDPDSTQTYWLRVASRNVIDLSTTIWAPADFQARETKVQFSISLALGALFLVMLFSLLALIITREWTYLFFALSMCGELMLESFRTGILQKHFWPATMPLSPSMAALGSMVAVVGFSTYFRAFISDYRRTGLLYRCFWLLVALTIAAQLWSIAVNYRAGTQIWSITVNGVLLTGIALASLLWRDGSRSGRMLVIGFGLLAVLELLRLGALLGWLPFFRHETIAGPWSLVLTTPIVLLSIVHRSKELQDKLVLSEQEINVRIRFLAQMSHELRTPLDRILGNAQLLSRPNGVQLAPDGLAGIQSSSRQLLGMIDEILDHARGEIGKLSTNPQAVNFPQFLASVEQGANLMIMRSQHTFSLTIKSQMPDCVMVDSSRLRQILDNLITNAVRHTQDAAISLQCEATKADGQRVRLAFSVDDNGAGIPTDDLERIFLPFERGIEAHRYYGSGTGMGLAISRQLVRAMGGDLTVASIPGKGSTFHFALDLETCASADAATRLEIAYPMGRYSGPPRRILLIDDEISNRAVLCALLKDCGFIVNVAGSGKEALDSLHHVDLVLTDQFMANGDGWLVLWECRKLKPTFPAILISAAPAQRPPDLADSIQFDACFLKPVEHAALLQCIGELLQLKWQALPILKEPSIATIVFPEDNALGELRKLIDDGEMTRIMEWAENLKVGQPALGDYADQVYTAARQLNFDELECLIRKN